MRSSASSVHSGAGATRFEVGERIGVAWLRGTCGSCRFCRRGDENLCVHLRCTGWDADGGYAEYAVVDERFAYRLPDGYSDEELAPLLCAGIIGFRALRRAAAAGRRPTRDLRLRGSAHLAAQVAIAEGATVHVMTRSAEARRLALRLGAASAGDTFDRAAGATWTRRSSSLRSATSCRPRWRRSIVAARWPSPAST